MYGDKSQGIGNEKRNKGDKMKFNSYISKNSKTILSISNHVNDNFRTFKNLRDVLKDKKNQTDSVLWNE